MSSCQDVMSWFVLRNFLLDPSGLLVLQKTDRRQLEFLVDEVLLDGDAELHYSHTATIY